MKKFLLALTLLIAFGVNGQPCKEVVGYYPDWQYYDRSTLLKPEKLDYSKYTVINYAFFNPQANATVVTGDSWATDNILLGPDVWSPTYYHDSTKSLPYLCKANGVKCLLSIGGWTWSTNFPTIAGSASLRTAFAHNCTDLVRQYKLDGIDIDWEYPAAGDKNNYTLLMQQLRDSLDAYGLVNNGRTYLLTGAYPAGPANIANYDWANLVPIIDMFNLMAYDFFGQWDANANHNAPLYAPTQGTNTFNCDAAVTLLTQTYNVPANKINMGIAFYGRFCQLHRFVRYAFGSRFQYFSGGTRVATVL
jgi:chitinase